MAELNRNLRVIVCGGRDYTDRKTVFAFLDKFVPGTVIEGGATGADNLAAAWAKANGAELITVRADWATYGRAAGPLRNQRMLAEFEPHGVIAFPGGKGTENMKQQARLAGVNVVEVWGVRDV